MTPILAPSGFRVIAHRGASGYAPENTCAAFDKAAAMQATDIEFDLQLTADGEMVVVHDRALDRYGHPGGVVAEMTLAELKSLDMGRWFGAGEFAGERMLTASELFDAFGQRFFLHAEIKEPSAVLVRSLADYLKRFSLEERTVVTSFDFSALELFHDLMPEQPIGWLVRTGGFTDANVQRAVAKGFGQFCPAAEDLTPEAVTRARDAIGTVRAHGIRNREDAEKAVAAGCDGMTINWPDWIAVA